MAFTKIIPFVFLLCILVDLQTAITANPLSYSCATSQNFTENSPYETNLNRLMAFLTYKSPLTGFAKGSMGHQAYGLALSRGDGSALDCVKCVAKASSKIRTLCPNNKGGIIWYDYCMLKYSDNDFFGQIDHGTTVYLWNPSNATDTRLLNQKSRELLTRLSIEASGTPKLYAMGEIKLDGLSKIYGLVQCTRDLTGYECKKCIDDSVNQLPNCCDGKQGGGVLGGSCNVRYETYPFVKG